MATIKVTPFAGVWIEMSMWERIIGIIASLPSRECGLKCCVICAECNICVVTPFAGVWIEIRETCLCFYSGVVTPFAGVWIEITKDFVNACGSSSLPSRECGLKCMASFFNSPLVLVTPFAGVWIEIACGVSVYESAAGSLPSRECGLK